LDGKSESILVRIPPNPDQRLVDISKINKSGRIGDQSFDAKAGSSLNMFEFGMIGHNTPGLFLDNLTGLQK
jgi:hypothetical protein